MYVYDWILHTKLACRHPYTTIINKTYVHINKTNYVASYIVWLGLLMGNKFDKLASIN